MAESRNIDCGGPAIRVFSNVDVGTAYANLVEAIKVLENLVAPQPQAPVAREWAPFIPYEQGPAPPAVESSLQVTSSSSENTERVAGIYRRMPIQQPERNSPYGEPRVSSTTTSTEFLIEIFKPKEVKKVKPAKPIEVTAYFHGISRYMVENRIDEDTFKTIEATVDGLLNSVGGSKNLRNSRF